MSEENVEIVRRLQELFRNRDSTADAEFGERDVAVAIELFHPDFELDTNRAPMPDLRGRFRGLRDVMGIWRGWLEAWDGLEFDEELTDAGDNVLAAIKRQTMRGKGSGIEVEFPPAWQVFTVRDGLVDPSTTATGGSVRHRRHPGRSDANRRRRAIGSPVRARRPAGRIRPCEPSGPGPPPHSSWRSPLR